MYEAILKIILGIIGIILLILAFKLCVISERNLEKALRKKWENEQKENQERRTKSKPIKNYEMWKSKKTGKP